MNRIETILKYISKNDKVLDIGCDSAVLGISLAKKELYSYAGDIRKNIVDRVKSNLEKNNLDKYITLKVSDGLDKFHTDDINTLVLSGIGTFTILDIIKKEKKLYDKIITVSNNDHYKLRKEMINLGYRIKLEEIVIDKNKYYNLIIFEKGLQHLSEKELILGFNHQNIINLKKYKKYKISKIKKILNSDLPITRKEELNQILKSIK